MQSYFNAKYMARASDFQNAAISEFPAYTYICSGGYVTTKTSVGSEVCSATLRYNDTNSSYRQWTGKNIMVEKLSCWLR